MSTGCTVQPVCKITACVSALIRDHYRTLSRNQKLPPGDKNRQEKITVKRDSYSDSEQKRNLHFRKAKDSKIEYTNQINKLSEREEVKKYQSYHRKG
jgi:hypothetical protein